MGRDGAIENGLERGPSPEEVNVYLERIGRERFSYELGILAQEPFRAAGPEARAAGWGGLELRAVMSGLLAEKVADAMGLPPEDKKLIISAAVLMSPMRRVQYERHPDPAKITLEERIALDSEGSAELTKRGVPEDVVKLTEANNPNFSIRMNTPVSSPGFLMKLLSSRARETARIERLQKILLFVHDCVSQERVELPDGTKAWKTDVSDWRQRLAEAGTTYKAIAAKRIPDFDSTKPDPTYFDVEARVVAAAERDIVVAMKKKNPRQKISKNCPLADGFREEVMRDIAAGVGLVA